MDIDKDVDKALVGARIRAERTLLGMSRAALGEKIGRTASAIGNYEVGKRELNYDLLNKIAAVFGVSLDYLLGLTPDRTGKAAQIQPREPAEDTMWTLIGKIVDALKEAENKGIISKEETVWMLRDVLSQVTFRIEKARE